MVRLRLHPLMPHCCCCCCHWNTNICAQLPLGLLTAAQGHPMLVELKNGETLNGHLANCDNWMNLILREVVQTSPEGDRFCKLPEVYVRGNNVGPPSLPLRQCVGWLNCANIHIYAQIKYLRIPEEIIDIVKEQQAARESSRGRGGGYGYRGDGRGDRGRRGGRGRGRGRGGGGGGDRGGN